MLAKRKLRTTLFLGCVIAHSATARTIIVPEQEATIQAAIDSAVDGDTVLVLPGTYTGAGNVNLRVEGVQLGIMGTISPRATVIDGEGTSRILSVQGAGTELVLERLTFANGRADQGGAILSDARLLQILGCRFEGNRALEGGAIASTGHILALTHCVMSGNQAERGIVVLENTLSDAINCVATENVAGDDGVFTATNSELSLINCTVTNNTGAALDLASTDSFVLNSILRNNGADQEIRSDRPLEVSYTNVLGGWEGEGFGNIDTDPRFISRFGFDTFLAPLSPCVDTGSPYIYDRMNGTHPRWPRAFPNGERSDMGAFGGDDNIDWLHYR